MTSPASMTIQPGDIWQPTSSKGPSYPVKVTRVTDQQVQFQPHGRAKVDGSKRFSLPIPAFRSKYSPDRPPEQPKPEPKTRPMPKARMMAPPPVAEVAVPAQRTRNGRAYNLPADPSLTDEQAREVYLLASPPDHPPYKEIGELYGVNAHLVGRIARKQTYKHAIEALDKEEPMPVDDGQITTGHVLPQQESAPPHTLYEKAGVLYYRNGVPTVKTLASVEIINELADVLELLLPFVGKPLPKYLAPDFGAIRGLIERARGEG